MNVFNEKEFLDICNKLSCKPQIREIDISYSKSSYFNKMKNSVETDRIGEVVFAVMRSNGNIITITCEEYPSGIYRIPTGGIKHNEDIVEAVFREVKEELGLYVEIINFAGVLKFKFICEDESVMFYSYLFIMKEVGGRLLLDATDDEVSEIKEVDLEGLEQIVNTLKDIPGRWNDWGRFRHETSNAILKYLKENYGQ
jgi:8-oxo-dGTP diphosphatase